MSLFRIQSSALLGKKKVQGKPSKAKVSKKVKASADDEEEPKLSPLEKARLARAKGAKGAKKTKRPARKVFTFPAPSDMKAGLFKILVVIGKDGLPTKMTVNAYRGKPGGATTKVLPLHVYDPETLVKVGVRLGAALWANRVDKRLPPKSIFSVLLRVGKNKEGNLLSRIRGVSMKSGEGKFKEVKRETDIGKLALRMFRKLHKVGPAAFTQLKPFPDAKQYKAIVAAMEGQSETEGKPMKKEKEAPAKKAAKKPAAKKVAAKKPAAKKVAAKKPAKKSSKA